MCGIGGFTWNDKKLLSALLKHLKHRGPDDSGVYEDRDLTLGHRRLSIVDISKNGAQPMSNEDGTVWVTFNGEIYNYKKLRADLLQQGHRFQSETDTEVLVHAYESFGIDFLQKIEGEFAFALYDQIKRKLFLVRDRMGTKPLYYAHRGHDLIFSSELQAIIKSGFQQQFHLDKESLQLFVQQRCVFGQSTIVSEIKRLLPGECLSFDVGTKKSTRHFYWTYVTAAPPKEAPEPLVRSLLVESVLHRLQGDVPVGSYLSGGIDSSIVTGIAAPHYPGKFNTFSVSFEDNEELSEARYAEAVSAQYGTEHHHLVIGSNDLKRVDEIIRAADEPLADTAIIPNFFLGLEAARKKVKVVLTGDGADELFGGYEQYRMFKIARSLGPVRSAFRLGVPILSRMPLPVLGKINPFLPKLEDAIKPILEGLSKKDVAEGYNTLTSLHTPQELASVLKHPSKKNPFKEYFSREGRDTVNAICRVDQQTIMAEDYLMKVDKMTMAHSVEPRVPFLDYRLVELTNNLPSSLKVNFSKEKIILRAAFKDVLPKVVQTRKKQRFYVPVDKWLKSTDFLEEVFSSPIIQDNFNVSAIRSIYDKMSLGNLYRTRQLWTYVTLAKWQKQFGDRVG